MRGSLIMPDLRNAVANADRPARKGFRLDGILVYPLFGRRLRGSDDRQRKSRQLLVAALVATPPPVGDAAMRLS